MKWEQVTLGVMALILSALTAAVIVLCVLLVNTSNSLTDIDRDVDDLGRNLATLERKTNNLLDVQANISNQVSPMNNSYDLIETAVAICTSTVAEENAEIWTVKRDCNASSCNDICVISELKCTESVHTLTSPEAADGKQILMATLLGTNGCTSSSGCKPNFCCCRLVT